MIPWPGPVRGWLDRWHAPVVASVTGLLVGSLAQLGSGSSWSQPFLLAVLGLVVGLAAMGVRNGRAGRPFK
jgi:hypothetical protein